MALLVFCLGPIFLPCNVKIDDEHYKNPSEAAMNTPLGLGLGEGVMF